MRSNGTLDLTIVICTHNPRADYLERVIDGLKAQTLPRSQWELLVIDNASAEPLAGRVDLAWHPAARHVRETELGLTHARLRGIRESVSDLIVFVDDDNVLDPDYLEVAAGVAEARPYLAAWSGACRPAFDEPPPAWTRAYWGRLVIRPVEHDVWSNLPDLAATMPNGAGLCVRRLVADHYLGLHESGARGIVLDRKGGELLSGGDTDLCGCACDLGYGVGLFAALGLTHLIPPGRLTEDYLVRLVGGMAYTATVLSWLRPRGSVGPTPRWTARPARWLRLASMGVRQRRFYKAALDGEWRARRDLSQVTASTPPKTQTQDTPR